MQIRFLTVDGFNLIRRIFEARQPTSFEELASVVDAAQGSLRGFIDRYQPSHASVVLEEHDKTWRHLLYSDYKANRSATPELLLNHVDLFESSFGELGVTTCSVPSYEADDVIATIARMVSKHGGKVFILSSDKVYLQLLSDSIKVVDHYQRRTWSSADVKLNYGVRVDQYADYLALVGDKSNNVKGVPGIGPKSARKLLEEHGDLESIFDADSNNNKLVARVRDALRQARRCQRLANLKSDVELGRNLKSFRLMQKTD